MERILTFAKILFFVLFFSINAFANDLKNLIENAKNNPLIQAKDYETRALKEQKNALYASYLPKVDIGYAYQNTINPDILYPESANGPYIEASWLLFDGLKREGKFALQNHKIKSAEFAKEITKEQIFLKIIQNYFKALSINSKIKALNQQQKELQESLVKFELLYASGLASKDTLEAIKAKYSQNAYHIENAKVALDSLKEQIMLLSGTQEFMLKNAKLKEPQNMDFKDRADIKAKEFQAKSAKESKTQFTYFPTIALSNRLTFYDYHNRYAPGVLKIFMPSIKEEDYQNTFGISISMTIFDTFSIAKQRESAKYLALATQSEYAYSKDSQKREAKIAKNALHSAKEKIKWAQDSLKSAKITYAFAKEKFHANLIDYTQYLNALSLLLNAQSFSDESLFDYEIKKAEFIFSSGQDLEDFLED